MSEANRQTTPIVSKPAARADGRQAVLAAFSRALGCESHILRERPGILWQQMYNRLQWEAEPVRNVLESDLRERSKPRSRPWFHEKTRHRESSGLLATLAGHEHSIRSCAFSPDGRLVVSTDWSPTLRVWDVKKREVIRMEYDVQMGSACAFSPDGRVYLASGHAAGRVNLWDAESGELLRTLAGQEHVAECAFSPDGRFVLTSSPNAFYLWDAAAGAQLASFSSAERTWAGPCVWSPDQRFVVCSASSSRAGSVQVWDLERRRVLRTVEPRSAPFALSPDGGYVVAVETRYPDTTNNRTGADDHCLKLWDPETGRDIRVLGPREPEGSSACAVSPDGRLVISACGNDLRLWDADAATQIGLLTGHTGRVTCLAFSRDGRYVVSGSDDQTLKIWDVEREIAASEQAHATDIDAAAEGSVESHHSTETRIVSPDGRRCVSQSDGADRIRALQDSAERIRALRESGQPVTPILRFRRLDGGHAVACNFSPDGSFYVGSGGKGTVIVEVEGEQQAKLTTDGEAVIWDIDHQASPLGLAGSEGPPGAFAFSPDGCFVLAVIGGMMRLYDFGTGAEVRAFVGNTGGVHDFAFSPDGHLVVSAGGDQTMRLWDCQTGANLATMPIVSGLAEIEMDPSSPRLVYLENRVEADRSGMGTYLIGTRREVAIAGVEYGPLIVTAFESRDQLTVRCPSCRGEFPVKLRQLGQEADCPGADCGARLRLNPFTLALYLVQRREARVRLAEHRCG